MFLTLFVDDGLIMAKTKEIVDFVIGLLKAEYDITATDADTFVGVQIDRNREKR